jgi:hypothetical protein
MLALPARFIPLAFAFFLVLPDTAGAVTSGYLRDQPAGPIYTRVHTIPAGQSAVFETTNLRNNTYTVDFPDTVLHVFDVATNQQIAVSDDCGTERRSCVTLAATSSDRKVIVYVRAASNGRFGLANYRATLGGTLFSQGDFHFGGTTVSVGPIQANAWIETVEQNGGFVTPTVASSYDTLLMVLPATSTTNVLAIDNDSGAGLMSKLRLTSACSSCQIIVGDVRRSNAETRSPPGLVTLAWSDDALDSDGDGLSNHFETALGLNLNSADTDQDGILDGQEVLGIDDTGLQFPYYGADPLVPDLFLEVSYTNGAERWTGAEAEALARSYRINGFKNVNGAPITFKDLKKSGFIDSRDVRVHLDIGTTNFAQDESRFVWGSWSSPNNLASCAALSPLNPRTPRQASGQWHFLISGAGSTSAYGTCGQAVSWAGAHELGHQLGLDHGGYPNGGPTGNVAYPSIMNYSFVRVGEDPAFSTRRWTQALNPTAMLEASWAPAGTPVEMLAYIQPGNFTRTRRESSGANPIDFNTDNAFSSSAVRGSGTFSRATANANFSAWNSLGLNQDVELVWLPTTPKKLFLFHLYTKNGSSQLEYRYTTDVDACSLKQSNWWNQCVTFQGYTSLPSTAGVARFFGAERLLIDGQWKIFIAFVDTAGTLKFSVMDQNGALTTSSVPNGTGVVTGASVVRTSDSRMLVLAGVGAAGNSQIHAWQYDAINHSWASTRVPQTYVDGTPLKVSDSGISATMGYLTDSGATAQIVGALAEGNLIKMLRFDSGLKAWRLLSDLNASAMTGHGFWSDNKLAIAYVPYSTSVRESGRFFLSYNRPSAGRQNNFLVRTIGNDPNPAVDPVTGLQPRVLKWRLEGNEEYVGFEWDATVLGAGQDILYDLDYDNHLRGAEVSGAWSHTDGSSINSIVFLPTADGHFNFDLLDYDDWKVIRDNLRCSLGLCPRK